MKKLLTATILATTIGTATAAPIKGFAFDCSMHGVFRMHSWDYQIGVGTNTSTTDLFFVPRKTKG